MDHLITEAGDKASHLDRRRVLVEGIFFPLVVVIAHIFNCWKMMAKAASIMMIEKMA
jgi:hypothetical protein